MILHREGVDDWDVFLTCEVMDANGFKIASIVKGNMGIWHIYGQKMGIEECDKDELCSKVDREILAVTEEYSGEKTSK